MGLERLRAIRLDAAAASLIGTELARVEHVHGHEVAERKTPVHLDVGSAREQRLAHWHVLIPGLEGGGAAKQEKLRRSMIFRPGAGPIVPHLMVVEAHDEGRGRVRRLQVGIELIKAVAVTVVVEREDFVWIAWHNPDNGQGARSRPHDSPFVAVVAVVEYEIEPLLREAAPGGEEAVFIFLAAGDAEANLGNGHAGRRQRARAPDVAALAADRELVEIIARGIEPADLDMHRVADFGMRDCRAFLCDLTHAVVPCHGPFDLDRPFGHAGTPLQRLRRDLGPDHKTVGRRVARGDAQCEGISLECRGCAYSGRKQRAGREEETRSPKPAQQYAAVDGREVVDVPAPGNRKRHGTLPPVRRPLAFAQ